MSSMATSSISRSRVRLRVQRPRGVTLVELVVVLGMLGIIAAVAAIALRDPVRAYLDTNRRAELTDVADTALRRVARDVRLALPNSLRVSGANPVYLELLLTKNGGRYRARGDGGTGDALDFSAPDGSFDSLGALGAIAGRAVAANDIVVVQNLFSAPGIQLSNAYTYNQAAQGCSAATQLSPTCNTATIIGAAAIATGTRLTIAQRQFPQSSVGNRFHVIEPRGVSYVCDSGPVDANGDGTGTLRRVSNYTIALAQPVGAFPGAPVTALLAQYVTRCEITYDPLVLNQSLGLVSMRIELTRGNETVRLYHEVHVSNIP